jgi:hypothetical protein
MKGRTANPLIQQLLTHGPKQISIDLEKFQSKFLEELFLSLSVGWYDVG